MYSINDKYKEYIETELSLSPKCKIVVDGIEYNGKLIKTAPKITYKNSSMIGGFPAKTCNFEIYNFDNNLNFLGKEIAVYKGFTIDGEIQYIPQGIFIPAIDKITTNKTKKTISFKDIQDKRQLFDVPYINRLDWTKKHTGLEIIQDICDYVGVELETKDFGFATYLFNQPNFKENTSCTEVISRMAEICGSIAFISRDDKLVIKRQTSTGNSILRKRYSVLTKESLFGVINTVVLGNDGMDNDIVYPEKVSNRVEWKILDNPFVDLYKEEMIEEVSKFILGQSITPFTLNDFVDGFYLDLNDTIEIIDKNGEVFDGVILSYESTGRIKSTVKAEPQTKTLTDYKLAGSNKKELSEIRFSVNHNTKQIEALATEVSETSQKVTNLELSVNGIDATVKSQSTTITELQKGQQTLEKDLSTTNSNLDKTNENVSNLDKKIDGVSANFEDFKDNEYIKSIENLQDQIDGAIQFWNGAEIPTVNNYPASDWTTENDRNNHRADIYTVIEDVEGELKQGKSYRFDKVNGTWQWIELTDNELSAVQALAEQAQKAAEQAQATATEANNRSKENSTSITKLQETDVELKLGLDSIDERVHTTETITSDLKPTDEARGTELVLKNSAGMTLLEFEAEGNVRQETKTSDNLFYINWLKASNITIQNDEAIGTALDFHNNFHKDGLCIPNTNYGNKTLTISITAYCEESLNDTNGLYFYVIYSDDTKSIVGPFKNNDTTKKTVTFTTNGKSIKSLDVTYGNGPTNIWHISEIMVVEGNTPKEYEPYVLMPSPDFPSDVETVEGIENLFNINDVNRIYSASENLDYKIDGNKLTLTAIGNVGAQYIVYQMSNLEATKTYTISFKAKKVVKGTNGFSRIYLRIYYSDDNLDYQILENFQITNPTQGQEYFLSGQITGHKYYKLYFYNNNDTPVMLGEQTEYYDIQLKKGTEANPFVPFGKYIIFKKMGLNLYDYKDTIVVSSDAIADENGFITLKYDNSSGANIIYQNYFTHNLNLKENARYSIITEIKSKTGNGYLNIISSHNDSQFQNNISFNFNDISSSVLVIEGVTKNNFDNTLCGLRTYASFHPGQSGSITFRISVLNDTTITEENFVYEPFVEAEQLNIDFKDNFVGKLTDEIKDRLYYQNRHLYIEKQVGRITINSSSLVNITQVNSKGLAVTPPNKKYSANNGAYSDKAKYATGSGQFKANTFYENPQNFVFVGTPDDTLETIQAKFNGGLLYYALETPEIVDLGEYDLSTFKDTNYIQLISKLETELYCKYARYTEAQEIYQTKDGMLDYYNKYETDTQILLSKNEIESHVQEVRTLVDENGQALSQIQNQVQETITSTQAQFSVIDERFAQGVTKLKNTLVTIDIAGLSIASNLDKFKSLITNKYILVSSSDKEIAFFGYDDDLGKTIARINELESKKVKGGYHRWEGFIDENGEKRSGWFYDGGDD